MTEQPARTAAAWVAALALYVVLGVTTKSAVLNWIVGPVFPLLVLVLVPRALRRGRPGAGRSPAVR